MRDVELTMSDGQSLSIPEGTSELSDTNSSDEVPQAGESGFSGVTHPLNWHVIAREATSSPVQVEGTLLARLQVSIDGGGSWLTDQEVEMVIARDHAAPDPCLPASGKAVNSVLIGRPHAQQGEPPTDIRYRTVYSTDLREAGDAAAIVIVSSFLSGIGEHAN